MKTMSFASVTLPLALTASLLAGGCSKQAPQQAATPAQPSSQANAQPAQGSQMAPNAASQQAINPDAATMQQPTQSQQQQTGSSYAQQQPTPTRTPETRTQNAAAARIPAAAPVSYTIPAGTHITVTTREEINSKTSQPGQSFSATVTRPVVVRGVTLIRAGSSASGTIITSKAQGRFKGQGSLAIRLDSVQSNGRTYDVASSTIDQIEKGKGKRTAVMAGGGGGLGALIGGLAGGGKGALIGGLVGAGGGTAGAAFTGNKPIIIPAETPLTFRLERPVTVGR